MPRYATRKARSADLMKKVARGPDLEGLIAFYGFTRPQVEKIKAEYRLWATTWILPELIELVPDLRDAQRSPISSKEPS